MDSERIRELNDLFRTTLLGGRIAFTPGVRALSSEKQQALITLLRAFATFTTDNDPYGEHDFGVMEMDGERFFWKIDYYDKTLTYASPDPANLALTVRVLTLMFASEY